MIDDVCEKYHIGTALIARRWVIDPSFAADFFAVGIEHALDMGGC
jgi:hypothetical protein